MIRDVLSTAANSLWPQISLIIFALCFAGIVIWVLTAKKQRFQHESQLPFEDGSEGHETSDHLSSSPRQSAAENNQNR